MIRKVLFFLFFFVLTVAPVVQGQNLVPNGGFEEVINCPSTINALDSDCAFWYKSIVDTTLPLEEIPSPDWYHTCATDPFFSPPATIWGYQDPFEGEAFAGVATYDVNNADYREIICVQLLQPLEVNHTYRVGFHIVRSHSLVTTVATNNFGFKFSSTEIANMSSQFINNSSSFKVDSILSDSLNWLEVSTEFIATQPYEYLHIGNFYDDANTDTLHLGTTFNRHGYYYVDNVRVEEVLEISTQFHANIRLFPNPCRNIIYLTSSEILQNFVIYGSSGMTLLDGKFHHDSEYSINVINLEKGLYFLKIYDRHNNPIILKFIKT